MLLEISTDELWPFYILDKPREHVKYSITVDLPEDLYSDYKKIMQDFAYIQNKIGNYYEEIAEVKRKKYEESVKFKRETEIKTVKYISDDEICCKCQRKQKHGIYKGEKYIGCEHCTAITSETPIWTSLLDDTSQICTASQNKDDREISSDWGNPITP